MGGTTTWKGVTLDQRTADMMDEVCRLRPDLPIWPSQGSYSGGVGASAGTHDGGGAIDIGAEDLTAAQRHDLESTMRCVGFAAWVRSPDQGGWPWHLHAIACDCVDLSGAARDQEGDYYAGRNGLANNGPDTGTRAYVGVTWETYQQQHKPPPSRRPDMITIRSDKSGTIYLLGTVALAGIANTNDLKELMAAMQNPNHTAVVSQATFDAIKKAT